MSRSNIIWVTLFALISTSVFAESTPSRLSGGKTTVKKDGANAFSMPAANLPMSKRLDFSVGNSFFRNPWVQAPASTDARDGLGPLFNTNGCQNCHIKDGRGHPPEANDQHAVSMLVRLSIPAETEEQKQAVKMSGVIPERPMVVSFKTLLFQIWHQKARYILLMMTSRCVSKMALRLCFVSQT